MPNERLMDNAQRTKATSTFYTHTIIFRPRSVICVDKLNLLCRPDNFCTRITTGNTRVHVNPVAGDRAGTRPEPLFGSNIGQTQWRI